MKKFLIVIAFVAFTSMAQNGPKNFIDQPYIEVTGISEMEITPDEIYLSITINEKDKKGRESVEKQENAMLKKLKNIGVNLKNDFKIMDFQSHYKTYFLKKTAILKAKEYQLIVHNGLMLGKVFQALESEDISNVRIVRTDHSELEAYKLKAKLNALKIAKEKATSYANVIDQTLGKALFIQEVNYGNPMYRNQYNVSNEMVTLGYSKEKTEALNNIEFKKIKIRASVLTRFEIN